MITSTAFRRVVRVLGVSLPALGLAALLALIVPLHTARAGTSAAQAPAGFTQEPFDTTNMDAPWPGDDDDDSDQTNPTVPGDQNPAVQGADQNTPPPTVAPETKGIPAEPDSVLKAKITTPAAGGAPLDTLQFKAPGAAAAAAAAKRHAAEVKTTERRPFFGLHPAVFFLGMVIGHFAIVKAINH